MYNPDTGQWLIHNPTPLVQFIFYDGIKIVLIIFGLSLPVLLLLPRKYRWVNKYRQGLLIQFLAALLVPGTVGLLKASTNVACPKALTVYGGNIEYTTVFQHYPNNHKPARRQRCFPAGHASAGFALMALYFIPKSSRKKKWLLGSAIVLGWTMGLYKMFIGDHFFSHTLSTMLIAWLIIIAIAISCRRIAQSDIRSHVF